MTSEDEVTVCRVRLAALLEELDAAGQRTLLAYAESLVRQKAAPEVPASVATRPPGESVVEAIRRLNRGYPGLRNGTLLQPVGELLSQHMLDARAAEEVIDALEALYARAHADRAGRA